jgi:hypothetical protein
MSANPCSVLRRYCRPGYIYDRARSSMDGYRSRNNNYRLRLDLHFRH